METQTIETPIKPRRRVRKRPLNIQLQAALYEAEEASKPGVDANLRVLIQRRCEILAHLLRTTEHGKLLEARAKVSRLTEENARLREELEVSRGGSPEAARLRRLIAEHGGKNARI